MNIKIWLPVAAMVCLTACSTTREYKHNFATVKGALMERMDRQQWTAQSTEYSTYKEPLALTEGHLQYYHYQAPGTKIYYEVDIKHIDANRSEVSVYASDYDSWWYKILNEYTLQNDFHNRLEQRLKAGQWTRMNYEPNNYYARGNRRVKGGASSGGTSNTGIPAFDGNSFGASNDIPAFSGTTTTPPPASNNLSSPPPFNAGAATTTPPPAVTPPTPTPPAGNGTVIEDDFQMGDVLF